MKRLLVASFVLALLVPACAFAQNAFSGTWKVDPGSMQETGGKPMVMSFKDGMYTDDDTPAVSIKADGQDHAVSGHPSFDTVALKVIDDHTVERTQKKNGKTVWNGTFQVAQDGKTATGESTMYKDGSAAAKSKVRFDRVGKAPSGSNAAAGSWRMGKLISADADSLIDTYQVDGDKIDYKSASGSSYTATIGGNAVPFMENGKQSGTISVKRMGKDTLRETAERDGKTRFTSTMTISPDGKSMKTSNYSTKNKTTETWVSNKQ